MMVMWFTYDEFLPCDFMPLLMCIRDQGAHIRKRRVCVYVCQIAVYNKFSLVVVFEKQAKWTDHRRPGINVRDLVTFMAYSVYAYRWRLLPAYSDERLSRTRPVKTHYVNQSQSFRSLDHRFRSSCGGGGGYNDEISSTTQCNK